MAAVQRRGALGVETPYRTVSEAVQEFAGVIPIYLIAVKEKCVHIRGVSRSNRAH